MRQNDSEVNTVGGRYLRCLIYQNDAQETVVTLYPISLYFSFCFFFSLWTICITSGFQAVLSFNKQFFEIPSQISFHEEWQEECDFSPSRSVSCHELFVDWFWNNHCWFMKNEASTKRCLMHTLLKDNQMLRHTQSERLHTEITILTDASSTSMVVWEIDSKQVHLLSAKSTDSLSRTWLKEWK